MIVCGSLMVSMVYGASVVFEGYVDFVEFEKFRHFVYLRIFKDLKDLRARFFAEKKLMFLWGTLVHS